jgi:hypothetical protein
MWIRVTNDHDAPTRIVAEPWGDSVVLQPAQSIGVFWHGPDTAYVGVRVTSGQIELWAEGSQDVLLQLDRAGEMNREVAGSAGGVPSPPRFHRRSDIPSE